MQLPVVSSTFLCFTLAAAIGGPAHAFDSECENHHGDPCEDGPLATHGTWDTDTSEHAHIWQATSLLAGLPAALNETFELYTYTDGSYISSEGETVPSFYPAAFDQVLARHTRTTSIAELTQLPDFSYSLWDWASGNETCPVGDDITPERCHQLKAHMGVLNSNHFLPQAYYAYRHYHRLALKQARQCRRVGRTVSAGNEEAIAESYLRPCERLAMVYEAVGQHFLQDAWSMGHMWERWGTPNRKDASDHFDALAVATTTGLIHGSRASLQPALSFLGDFNDALCAPYHEEVQWKIPHSQTSHPAVGDMYFSEIMAPDDTFNLEDAGEFSEQALMLFSCAVNSMLEVYEQSGQHHGVAQPRAELLPLDPMREDHCFGQRATNEAMLKGAGIDVLWGGFWPYHLEMDSYTSTLAVLAATSYYADNYSDLSWVDYYWKQHRYRRDLARLMARMEIYAKLAPQGTQLARGAIGNIMNIKPNGQYTEAEGLADYIDVMPSPNDSASLSGDQPLDSEATARLFHQADGLVWCSRYSGPRGAEKLETLRQRVELADEHPERIAACGICTEVVTRHVRHGQHPSNYDQEREPLCALAALAAKRSFRPAFVYQVGPHEAETGELAQAWCGCAD